MSARLPRLVGLRSRLLAALVLTSAATLTVAALVLIPPLEGRLRGANEHALRDQALTFRRRFDRLRPGQLRVEGPRVEALTDALHRQTASRVVLRLRGHTLDDSESGRRAPPPPLPAPSSRAIVVSLPLRLSRGPGELILVKDYRSLSFVVPVVRRALIFAGLAGLALAALLAIVVTRRLLRRLENLTAVAHDVAAGAPLALPEDDGGHDEVADLARSFAAMQRRLERQEQARRTFVSTASHELRTPLASLAMMLELAGQDLLPGSERPERAREQVDRAREQAARLSALARDLLDLSRLDAGVDLRREPVDLAGVARAVAGEFVARAGEVGVELAVRAGEPVIALADPGAVAQIARILVDNALRFAPPGSEVEVVAGADGAAGGGVRIEVADAGPGVPPGELERIFERFARGADPGRASGFGLGLAIGRELAERMGATLGLTGPGPGARFVLELVTPPAGPDGQEDGPAPERPLAAASGDRPGNAT